MAWLWTMRATHTGLAYVGSRANDARDFKTPRAVHTGSRARQRITRKGGQGDSYPTRGRPRIDYVKFIPVSPVSVIKYVALTRMVPKLLVCEKRMVARG